MESLSVSANVGDSYTKQFRRCTVSNANGITKTQVYYPRPRSYSAGSQNTTVPTSKRLSSPVTSTNATPAMKVMRINTKLYGKAKSLEEGKRALGSPTGGNSTMRYKTELCRPFQENGFCKYGDKCQFAHGEQDLRCLPRHPKYKTELCRTYHTRGFCPYGLRCHFIHSIDETRNMENGVPPPSSPTKKTFSFNTPLSPSLDSGISSPDDYQRGKYFEFPAGDHSSSGSGSGSDSDYRDYDHTFDPDVGSYIPSYQDSITSSDPFLELDMNSIGNDSPSKPLPEEFTMDAYSMKEMFTQMTLEDSTSSSSCHRLPVFDDILNTKSDSALLEQNHSLPNPFGFFNA